MDNFLHNLGTIAGRPRPPYPALKLVKNASMLNGFIVLLIFFLLGEFIANLFSWPIPGSVMGMLLLFIFLVVRSGVPKSIKSSSNSLLPFLPLFIVPASVGIVSHLYLLRQDGIIIVVAMVVSLLVGIPLCGWMMQTILKWQGK